MRLYRYLSIYRMCRGVSAIKTATTAVCLCPLTQLLASHSVSTSHITPKALLGHSALHYAALSHCYAGKSDAVNTGNEMLICKMGMRWMEGKWWGRKGDRVWMNEDTCGSWEATFTPPPPSLLRSYSRYSWPYWNLLALIHILCMYN